MHFKPIIHLSTAIALCLFSVILKGQVKTIDVSKIIPPSPNSASLGEFGNNSKGAFNGVPQINIPIYSTTAGGQNINLSLSYDASGTRAAQDASWVGLGWSFAYGGGVINRTVRGVDDLFFRGHHFSENLPTDAQILSTTNPALMTDWKSNLRNGWTDGEPDIFSFSFGEHNGKFVFDKTVNGSSILQLESTNLKISYIGPGWKIIDGDGNTYYFNAQETATDYSLTTTSDLTFDAQASALTDEDIDRHAIVTSWYLDSIITNTAEKIRFTYLDEPSQSLLFKSEQMFDLVEDLTPNSCESPSNHIQTFTASRQLLSNKIPQKILFDNGSIEFTTSSRNDIQTEGNPNSSALASVIARNSSGELVKKVNFYYSYFNSGGGIDERRLKLDSIRDVTGQSQLPPHIFTYFNPNSLPSKNTRAIDHWGYFNNQTGNANLLPAGFVTSPMYRTFAGGNRRPSADLNHVQNGVLASITYPTGGKTDFTYELNEYTNLYGDDAYDISEESRSLVSAGSNSFSASFSISETREFTFLFEYHDPNNLDYMDEFIADYAELYKNGQYYATFRNHQHDANKPFYINSQKLILAPGNYSMHLNGISGYSTWFAANWTARQPATLRKGGGLRVSKIVNSDGEGNSTVKRFVYTHLGTPTGLLLLPVKYDFIATIGVNLPCEINQTMSYYAGSYFCRYSNSLSSLGFTNNGLVGYSKVTELSGDNGENGKVEYYFHNTAITPPSRPWQPMLANPLNGKPKTTIVYDSSNAMLKKSEYTYQVASSGNPNIIRGVKIFGIPVHNDAYEIYSYLNESKWIKSSGETDTTYSSAGKTGVSKNFYYENADHKQLTKAEETSSAGTLLTSVFKYPADLKSAGAPNVYNAMSNLNMHNPVIEKSEYTGNNFMQSSRTEYDYWKNSSWGDNTSTLILPRTMETKLLNNNAEIRSRYITYDQGGNPTSFSQENGPQTVIIWSYKKKYPVAKIEHADLQTVKSVLLTAGINADNLANELQPSDSYLLNMFSVLRNGLSNASVSGYTYKPMVGITSTTDPKGDTVYYNYDDFQRLKSVKDINSNVKKAIDYNYKN